MAQRYFSLFLGAGDDALLSRQPHQVPRAAFDAQS
jgi:hypothetical protein